MRKNILKENDDMKIKLNKGVREQKAITLIALVITIIVLLILAAVSIAMLTGENGLLTKATTAGEKTKMAEAREKVQLILQEYAILKHTSTTNFGNFLDNKKNESNEIDEYTKSEETGSTKWTIEIGKYAFDVEEPTLKIVGEGLAGLRPRANVVMQTTGYVKQGSNVEFEIEVTLLEELTGATVTIEKPNGVTETDGVYSVAENGTYRFEIIASKDGNDYKTTAIVTIDTILEKPEITVTDIGSTYFTINVTNEYPQDSNIKYEYYVGNSAVTEKIYNKSYKKEGLSAGTSYSVKVRAYIDETNYMESNAVTVETKGTEIRTVQDLRNISSNMSGKYQLVNDIDMSGVSWTAIGGNNVSFTGTLDGNGFSIKNLSGTNNSTKVSLFFRLDNATIKNIGLKNVNIYCGSGWGGGSLAYDAQGTTKIQNVYLTGTINDGGAYGGALLGSVSRHGGTVSLENIYINLTNDIGSDTLAGGSDAGTYNNCIVINGGMPNFTGIRNSYYYTTTAGTYGGTALTLDTMRNRNTFTGFDFDNIWYMDDTAGHPKLRICK